MHSPPGAAPASITTRCCSCKVSAMPLRERMEKPRVLTDLKKKKNHPDIHFNRQRDVTAMWALFPQTQHHLQSNFLALKQPFFPLSVLRITVGTMWLWPWDEFPLKFKLSLKTSRTSSLVSTCSDSEGPSLRLFTLKRLLNSSMYCEVSLKSETWWWFGIYCHPSITSQVQIRQQHAF